jgi:hypothetical protein
MKSLLLAAVLLPLLVPACWAQIATPVLSLPPCTGPHCLARQRGATAPHSAAPSAVKQACPQGTVYDAYKGVCRVMPPAH